MEVKNRLNINQIPPLDFRFFDLFLIFFIAMGSLIIFVIIFGVGSGKILSLKILNTSLPNGILQNEYKAQVYVEGGIEPYSWTISGQPKGLNIDKNGLISGVTKDSGKFDVELKVIDNKKSIVKKNLLLKVINIGLLTTLEVKTTCIPAGILGKKYHVVLAANGGLPPYKWKVSGLPEGLKIKGDLIEGIPKKSGLFKLDIEVVDEQLLKDKKQIPFQVLLTLNNAGAAEVMPLEFSFVPPLIIASEPYIMQLSAKGGLPPYNWVSYSVFPGLNIAQDGILTIEADADFDLLEKHKISVMVFDNTLQSKIANFNFKVYHPKTSFIKTMIALTATASWIALVLLLKFFCSGKTIKIGIRNQDFAAFLSILLMLIAVVIALNSYFGSILFCTFIITLSLYIYFKSN